MQRDNTNDSFMPSVNYMYINKVEIQCKRVSNVSFKSFAMLFDDGVLYCPFFIMANRFVTQTDVSSFSVPK